MDNISCEIVAVGKRRDGKMRHWCVAHKANATGKYGVKLSKCVKADLLPPTESEILTLDLRKYKGGVALWGAIPAVYDTTTKKVDRGVHVHARKEAQGHKEIDNTFRQLLIEYGENEPLNISEEDAIYYMTAVVMGFDLKYVTCNHCQYPHLDKDVLAVNLHRKHLCAGCGREFYDPKGAHIGNPLVKLKELLNDTEIQRKTMKPERVLDIKQQDYLGGIQIWGSNQAILWTAPVLEEEGIHVHCYSDTGERIIDDTFGTVLIDGVKLSPEMVRFFMAQSALPHLRDSLYSLVCPSCDNLHFDTNEYSCKPHTQHICESCGEEFKSPFRKKKTISNPILSILSKLEKNGVAKRQSPFLDLQAEGRTK